MTATATATRCAYEWSGYPHSGCAEFGEPDHFECSATATWRVWFPPTGEPYDDEDGTVVDFCSEHYAAEEIMAEAPDAEAVLIADLPEIRCGGCGEIVWILHPQGHTSPCDYCRMNGLTEAYGRGLDHSACACPEAAAYEAAFAGEPVA